MTPSRPSRHLGEAALDTAHRVARALSDPLHAAARTRAGLAALPADLMLPAWQGSSVLLGHSGVALLQLRCARHDPAALVAARAHLVAAATACPGAGAASAGDLVLPALLYLRHTGAGGKLPAQAMDAHTAALASRTSRLRAPVDRRPGGPAYHHYDAITGLSRHGRILLLSAATGHARASHVLAGVLTRLVELTRPAEVDGITVPGWWCAPEHYLVPRDRETFPRGDFNTGAAHGICGPLTLLSLARLAGYGVPGDADAIRRVVDWLAQHTHRGPEGEPAWPGRISYEEQTAGRAGRPPAPAAGPAHPARIRPGWCYGTSGVAGALHLAGRALADPAVTRTAARALRGLLRRSPEELAADQDPGLCHGLAGILHATTLMAAATDDPALWNGADRLAEALLAAYSPDAAFGYRRPVQGTTPLTHLDSCALLDGATGVALALASYAEPPRPADPPGWDAALLMS
ncbi:lanthionine synthetase C family protein [Streptomyces sp. NPDC056160]|uniref:lanthionine synthetase C family protein n=1 Tax=Streptomyces sp. NPDC056160 TaxID=3345731 RepID=UPI0035E28DA3